MRHANNPRADARQHNKAANVGLPVGKLTTDLTKRLPNNPLIQEHKMLESALLFISV